MFIRNVFHLGLANVAAQVLSLLIVPLLTRLYSPLDYGAFSIYLAVLSTLIPISSLRFHTAIAIATKSEDSMAVFMIALGVGFWNYISIPTHLTDSLLGCLAR